MSQNVTECFFVTMKLTKIGFLLDERMDAINRQHVQIKNVVAIIKRNRYASK